MSASKSIKVQTNVVFEHLQSSSKRFVVEQGGTRSGKTYNILTWLIVGYLLQETGQTLSIVRKTMPSLRATAMRDFFTILDGLGLYDPNMHNRTNMEYTINANLVEFISCDQPQKLRGRKRNTLFMNEANEIQKEDYLQMNLRTSDRVILDYNPSDAFHWIYDDIIPRDDCDFYKTTYLDNPFLPDSLKAEILQLKEADPDYWRVYGMGERAELTNSVFGHWREVPAVPADFRLIGYGLDFGYSVDPSAMVGVYTDGNSYCFDELIYRTGMTNADIGNTMRDLGISRSDAVVADSAEPKSIDQIHGMGFNIHPCEKGPDSVRAGIDYLRSRPLLVTSRSVNGIKELRGYRWAEDKNGQPLNKPLGRDHFIDACRYGAMWMAKRPNYGQYAIS